MVLTAQPKTLAQDIVARVTAYIEARRTEAAKRAAYERTVKALATRSERELEDLGMNYADIEGRAAQATFKNN
jgi:uncharacterized protein YjiS (DUF1127 family)